MGPFLDQIQDDSAVQIASIAKEAILLGNREIMKPLGMSWGRKK
jgi:hypothetical protein